MKKFKFKWLLLSFILSIASINTAWANTYYYSGNGNYNNDLWTWQTDVAMTVSADGYYEYYQITSHCTHRFKIGISGSSYAYNYSYVDRSFRSIGHFLGCLEIGMRQ